MEYNTPYGFARNVKNLYLVQDVTCTIGIMIFVFNGFLKRKGRF